MTTAPLNFSVDTTPLDKGVVSLNAVAGAAGNTEAAVDRMAAGVTSRLQAAANGIESLAARINRAMNIDAGGSGGAAASAAAISREMDGLRAKFDPLFAVATRYRGVVAEINQAHSVGALNANQRSEAIERERAATDRLVASMQRAGQIRLSMGQQINQNQNVRHAGANMGDAEQSANAFTTGLRGLRAEIDPLYRIGQQYRETVERINTAHLAGAVTSEQRVAALERERRATQQLVATERELQASGMSGQQGRVQRSGMHDQQRMLSTNLMYQMQDVAVTSAMGMPVGMIALQQGMQAGGMLQMMSGTVDAQGKAISGFKAMGGAIAALVSPINLGAVAFTAASAAAIQYFMNSEKQAKELEDAIADTDKRIRGLAEAYGVAGVALDDFTRKSAIESEAGGRRSGIGLEAELRQEREKLVNQFTMEGTGLFDVLGGGDPVKQLQFKAIMDELQPLIEQMKIGALSVEDLQKEVNKLGEAGGNADVVAPFIDEIFRMNGLDPVNDKVRNLSDLLILLMENAVKAERALKGLDITNRDGKTGRLPGTERMDAAAEAGRRKMEEDRVQRDLQIRVEDDRARARMEADLQTMRAKSPEDRAAAAGAGARAGAMDRSEMERELEAERAATEELARAKYDLEEAERHRLAALEDTLNAERLNLAVIGRSIGETAALQMQLRLLTEAQRAAENAGVDVTDAQKKSIADASRAYGEYITQIDAATKALERQKQQARDIESAREELTLVGQTAGETARLRYEYAEIADLKREAAERGEEASEKEIDAIRRTAAELGLIEAQLVRINLQRDIMFERDQLFRSDTEAGIAQRLQGTGIGMDSPEANFMRETAMLQDLRDETHAFLGDFKSALMNGEDIGKALMTSIVGSLQRAGDKLLEQAADQLFNFLSKALFGAGPGGAATGGETLAGGFINKIFGGGATSFPTGAASTFFPPVPPAPTAFASVAAAPVGAVSRGMGGAVDMAGSLLGLSENANAGSINAFLQAGGVDLNAAQTAWCAAFVNSSLGQIGIEGSGSNVATSFMNWGTKVDPSEILKGDVLVQSRGLSAGQVGGHVGMATGATRMGSGGLELEMLSGNTGGRGLGTGGVGKDWIKASQLEIRRATEGVGKLGDVSTQAAESTKALTDATQTASNSAGNLTGAAGAAAETTGALAGASGGAANSLGNFATMMSSMGGGGGGGFLNGIFGLLGGSMSGGWGTTFGTGVGAMWSNSPRLFAGGGVSDGPAIFGEAGPEAAVPLPDGRTIPVTLKRGGGANDNGGVVIQGSTYNFTGTSEEFQDFKKFVMKKEQNRQAEIVNTVRRANKTRTKLR